MNSIKASQVLIINTIRNCVQILVLLTEKEEDRRSGQFSRKKKMGSILEIPMQEL